MGIFSVGFWLGAIYALYMGFNKMTVYENSEIYVEENKNVYVGGDAYNYIINGTYATGYFVLFGACLIAGFLVEILISMKKTRTAITEQKALGNNVIFDDVKVDMEADSK